MHRSVQKAHAGNGWSGDSADFGTSTALLLGDLALAWADDLFHDGLDRLGHPAGAAAAWRAMRTEVLGGQLLDLRISVDESPDPRLAAADALVVNRYKTAAYTVERPLHLGAALGGATPATIDALRRYGTAIGVGFQLRDDLLGVFGDPSRTGKPAGGDLIEGKKTVLLALTRQALLDQPDRLAELDAGIGSCPRPGGGRPAHRLGGRHLGTCTDRGPDRWAGHRWTGRTGCDRRSGRPAHRSEHGRPVASAGHGGFGSRPLNLLRSEAGDLCPAVHFPTPVLAQGGDRPARQ